jgi:hypothetical protein
LFVLTQLYQIGSEEVTLGSLRWIGQGLEVVNFFQKHQAVDG